MILVNTYQLSDKEYSALHEMKSEGFSDVDIDLLLKEYHDQEPLDYDYITSSEEPSQRGGPTRRRRPGSSRRRQTLFQFLMRKLSSRRKLRPRPRPKVRPRPQQRPSYGAPTRRPQYGPPRKRRPSYKKPKPTYDISQVQVEPFDEYAAPPAPGPASTLQTYQEDPPTEVATAYSGTTSAPALPAETASDSPHLASTSSYDTTVSLRDPTSPPSPGPWSYNEQTRGSSSSPQNSGAKFSFPPFPFDSLDRDKFFENFKSECSSCVNFVLLSHKSSLDSAANYVQRPAVSEGYKRPSEPAENLGDYQPPPERPQTNYILPAAANVNYDDPPKQTYQNQITFLLNRDQITFLPNQNQITFLLNQN